MPPTSRSRVIAILLTTIAWATQATATTDGITLSPTQITQGKERDITVRTSSREAVSRLSLSPGSTQLKRQWSLPFRGQDLVRDDEHVYIAAGRGGLLVLNRNAKDYPIEGRVSFGDAVHALSIAYGHAWLGTDSGVYTADIREPDSPRLRGYIDTEQPVSDIASNDDYAIVAAGKQVRVYDSRKPSVLLALTTLQLQQPALAVAIDGNRVYIAEGNAGVERYIIDAEQKLRPAAHYRTTGPAVDIQTGDGIAAVALRDNGLLLLDIDNGALNWLGSHQQIGDVTRLYLDAQSRQVIVGNRQDQLMLVDVSDPKLPTVIVARQLAAAPAAMQLVKEQVMVLAGDELQQIDFGFTPPRYSNEGLDFGQGVNYGGERRVYIRDDIAYVADWFSGIHLYDISNPGRPTLLSTFHTDGSSKGIVVRGDYAYVGDDDHGLQIINIADPRNPERTSQLPTAGLAYIPVLDGDRLYLAGHRGGFQVIDVSDVDNPALLGEYDTQGKTWAIRVRDNIAYIADDDSGLMMFDVSDPNDIQLVGQFSPGGAAEDVILDGDIAYVAFFDRGVYVVDIRDPGYPKKLAHIRTPGNARGLVRNGSLLYIADWLSGIQIQDVSTPTRPRLVGSYDTLGAAWGLAVVPPYAYVMDWWGGFSVLDVSTPERPTLAGRYHERDRVHDIDTRDNVAYAASGDGGLQLYDIKNPLNPTWMTGVDLDSPATLIATHGERAYVALKDRHIAVIDVSKPFAAHPLDEIRTRYTITSLQAQGDWLLVGHGDRGSTLYRIDGKYADRPRKERYYGTVQHGILMDNGRRLVGVDQEQVLAIYQPGERNPQRRLDLAAQILRPHGDAFISYSPDDGITILRPDGVLLGRMKTDMPVIDMQARNNTLFLLSDTHQLIAIDLSDPAKPEPAGRYQLFSPIDRVSPGDGAVYLSGNSSIVALKTLPRIDWEPADKNAYVIHAPADLPVGDYTVTINDHRYANALSVVRQKFSKPRFTMEDLKKALDKIHQQQQ